MGHDRSSLHDIPLRSSRSRRSAELSRSQSAGDPSIIGRRLADGGPANSSASGDILSAAHPIWNFITDCGDSAITIPLSLLIFCMLAGGVSTRAAIGWLIPIGSCIAIIGLAKFLFLSCGRHFLSITFDPSGHAAMSMAVYGSLGLLVGASTPRRWHPAVFAATLLFIVAIAVSRVILGDHTPAEVLAGLVVGAATVLGFKWALPEARLTGWPLWLLILTSILLIALIHGTRWPAEEILRGLARMFHKAVQQCR